MKTVVEIGGPVHPLGELVHERPQGVDHGGADLDGQRFHRAAKLLHAAPEVVHLGGGHALGFARLGDGFGHFLQGLAAALDEFQRDGGVGALAEHGLHEGHAAFVVQVRQRFVHIAQNVGHGAHVVFGVIDGDAVPLELLGRVIGGSGQRLQHGGQARAGLLPADSLIAQLGQYGHELLEGDAKRLCHRPRVLHGVSQVGDFKGGGVGRGGQGIGHHTHVFAGQAEDVHGVGGDLGGGRHF